MAKKAKFPCLHVVPFRFVSTSLEIIYHIHVNKGEICTLRNFYFVQVDVSATMGAKNAYLPYTAGILIAAAWQSKIVRSCYTFREIIFLREDISSVLTRMELPAVVAFSNYCWNTEYNKCLAQAIKESSPESVTIFGGHNVPNDFSFLQELPYVDILCHGEGEETIRLLLETLAQKNDLVTVPNISYRLPDGTCQRTQTSCARALDTPSPYLDGWFDSLLEQHPEITFNAILETSRGCPNQCAYCDWGLLRDKVRLVPTNRVKAEIKWMSAHKIAFVWGADANFGMFKRDLEIADALVKAKKETGYPERMRMNYAKNSFENVFAIVQKFKTCDFDRIGATLSFQSLSPEVLKNIGRTNKDLEFYRNLLTKYNQAGMKAYSELILGLPGETYESFIQGIGKLFEIGQHFVFEVYGCILLPNAQLGQKDAIEKFGIKTVKCEVIRQHIQNADFAIKEYDTIVVETASMSREMWVQANVFYYIAKVFHGNGLLRVFAVYLYQEKGVAYETFYDRSRIYLEQHPSLFASRIFSEIKKHAEKMSRDGENSLMIFEPCGDVGWDDHEYAVLHFLDRLDQFYDEMIPYLQTFGIAEDIFEDLLQYQKNIIRKPNDEKKSVDLHYAVHRFMCDAYVNNLHSLEKEEHTLIMRDSNVMRNWPDFGKYVVWYGRMGWASYKDEITVVPKEPVNAVGIDRDIDRDDDR